MPFVRRTPSCTNVRNQVVTAHGGPVISAQATDACQRRVAEYQELCKADLTDQRQVRLQALKCLVDPIPLVQDNSLNDLRHWSNVFFFRDIGAVRREPSKTVIQITVRKVGQCQEALRVHGAELRTRGEMIAPRLAQDRRRLAKLSKFGERVAAKIADQTAFKIA